MLLSIFARPSRISLLAAIWFWLLTSAATAGVLRFEITSRETFAAGAEFGATGPYERIVGKVYYTLDPDAAANAAVVDLEHAPRNGAGQVEFSGDLFLLKPVDMAKGNGTLLYDVNNRGIKLALRFFNDADGNNDPRSAADAGHGFLLRQGYTVVWSGWNGEVLPGEHRMRLQVPVAKGADGPLTGLVRCEIVTDKPRVTRATVNRDHHGSYTPTTAGLSRATLTHREYVDDPREELPRDQWELHVTQIPDSSLPRVEVELPAGFQQGHLYEFIYEGQDPLVHGVSFTSVRDLISALKQGTGDGNPLAAESGEKGIDRAIGFGVSQSGRFLREFVYWGFNADEQGQKVFDGVIPHVSGSGLGSFNHRFAQPTRFAGQHDQHDYPPDRFPFAYSTETDPLAKTQDGILKRCTPATLPLILHTQSAAEYWTRSGSLTHTDPLGKQDLDIPENVRIYLFGGTQHGPSSFPPPSGLGENLENPGDYRPYLRGLLVALERWSRGEAAAPPSVYPTIAAGTLVDWPQPQTAFPQIPGIAYPQVIQQPSLLDFGPRWATERIIDRQPPVSQGDYKVLVPKCGPDGNELDCLSPPEVQVPVATYTGWNIRREKSGASGALVSLKGSYLPFSKTKAERTDREDPRPSLEERYGSLENYLRQLKAACDKRVAEGYLLPEDADRIFERQRERVAPLFPTAEQ